MRLTHLGTATVLLELGPFRLLTDPSLDEPGRTYGFGFGTRSQKTVAVPDAARSLGRIDAALVSHDHHADNLDDAGRALLPSLPTTLTTKAGAGRLASLLGSKVVGLLPGQTHTLEREGQRLTITATDARHGPPGSLPVVGHVVGFRLASETLLPRGDLWITGDSVLFNGLTEEAARGRIGTALLHVGGVRFPITGPLRFTMDAPEAATLGGLLPHATLVPIHTEGWTHFREPRANVQAAFDKAGLSPRSRWLPLGEPVELEG